MHDQSHPKPGGRRWSTFSVQASKNRGTIEGPKPKKQLIRRRKVERERDGKKGKRGRGSGVGGESHRIQPQVQDGELHQYH